MINDQGSLLCCALPKTGGARPHEQQPPAARRAADENSDVLSAASLPLTPPRGPKAHKDTARQLGIRGNSAAKLIVLSAVAAEQGERIRELVQEALGQLE